MPRSDQARSEPEIAAALRALDATLAGDPVDPEHAEHAELALILRSERPRPQEEFARRMDERATRRFARPASASGLAGASGSAGGSGWAEGSGSARGSGSAGGSGSARAWRRLRRWRLGTGAIAGTVAVAAVVALALVGAFATGGGQGGSSVSSTSSSASSTAASASAAPSPSSPSPSARSASGAPPSLPSPGARQVVQSAQVALAAAPDRIEDVAQQVFDVISAENGVVNSSNVTVHANYDGYADFQLSVPHAGLGATMSALSQLHGARVVSRSDASSDITGQVGGVGRRLADAHALRSSLLKQLAAATTPVQLADLRRALQGAETAIARDSSTLQGLHRQVDYSEIGLTVTGVAPAGPSSGASFTFGQALHDAGRVLVVGAGVSVIVLAVLVPVALIGGLLAWVAFLVRRRRREQALDLL